ncbi:DNA-binding response regulator, OmpR family, contains REC and winged-helix (wHTH) domain [Peptoclostridium litorale DSM 5388]|uniref:Stage 0 sporulation protein A homolog n=1 Tax=Peptoclostridium litorale DSM 5388 TaxID=1121324 RepID=A0A069RFM9_PEPLI|nr:response regulator transcription factor [Peptoclostridium litorale]KDR95000.1 Two component transcriptional regulator, winged helix family [Peptoclostridium litorale DSM 5388]SIN76771.1 DNA-binding response regulator, OmpR family, contains REC and winged-helix (wHTH) domain [Peptoclostridium litorale DSM 5388]
MNKTVLIVEDEKRIREIVCDYFCAAGFETIKAQDGRKAIEEFESNQVDLVILDIMMPELDGWSVCKRLRKKSNVPIIMLTARSDEDDKLMGFELGADEYVTKPFSPKVLVARSKVLLKRVEGSMGKSESCIEAGVIEISKDAMHVLVQGAEVELTPKEYELLVYMVDNKGIVLSRKAILDNVWGYDYFGDERAVDTHVKKLRKKLGEKSNYIRTITKAGYKFEVVE